MQADRDTPPTGPDWKADPLEWPRATGRIGQLLAAVEQRERRQRRRRFGLVAAAMIGVAALGLSVRGSWNPVGRTESARSLAAVAADHVQHQVLPDGSNVDLGAGARLGIHFTDAAAGQRRVTLEAGDAYFQVAKDAARPFIVAAGGFQFRAVGTAFSVRHRDGSVELLVTEGIVAAETSNPQSKVMVEAGQRLTLSVPGDLPIPIETISPETMRSALAWRVPRLEFNATPLREVILQLNKHCESPLVLSDERLGTILISGALRADHPEALLEMLADTHRIITTPGPDHTLILKQGPAPQSPNPAR